jgi:hypothetical protein
MKSLTFFLDVEKENKYYNEITNIFPGCREGKQILYSQKRRFADFWGRNEFVVPLGLYR